MCVSGAKTLIRALLEVDPSVRLTASQTLQNSWLLHAASKSDHETATKTCNTVVTGQDYLNSRGIKCENSQTNLKILLPEEKKEESFITENWLRPIADHQSLKRQSPKGETSRYGDKDSFAKLAAITEKSRPQSELPPSEQIKTSNINQQTLGRSIFKMENKNETAHYKINQISKIHNN